MRTKDTDTLKDVQDRQSKCVYLTAWGRVLSDICIDLVHKVMCEREREEEIKMDRWIEK